MALLAVASDKGSPGVTTTAMALAAVWPRRAVLAELDPSGGDVAFRMRGPGGAALSRDRGVPSLAASLGTADRPVSVFEHVQRLDGGLEVLLGRYTDEHTGALAGRWHDLGTFLNAIPGVDVVADVGRLYRESPALGALRQASGVVLVTRSSNNAVAHLLDRTTALARQMDSHTPGGLALYVVVLAAERDERSEREIDGVLRASNIPATVLGSIAFDPTAAGMLAGEWRGQFHKSPLVRTARDVAARLIRATVSRAMG